MALHRVFGELFTGGRGCGMSDRDALCSFLEPAVGNWDVVLSGGVGSEVLASGCSRRMWLWCLLDSHFG